MRAYQRNLEKFKALGASIIIVSPMTRQHTLETTEEFGLGFELLSDEGSTVIKQYSLGYSMPEIGRGAHLALGLDIPDSYGNELWELPVPATYVIDKDNIVQYAFVNFDHTRLALPGAVLKSIEKITTQH